MEDIIKQQVEKLAMAVTHSEQGFYDKNLEFVKSSIKQILEALIKREEKEMQRWNIEGKYAKKDTISYATQQISKLN